MINVYHDLKHEGKIPPRRQRHRWEDNVKIYLGEIMYEVVE
jgi:hypothetical protein